METSLSKRIEELKVLISNTKNKQGSMKEFDFINNEKAAMLYCEMDRLNNILSLAEKKKARLEETLQDKMERADAIRQEREEEYNRLPALAKAVVVLTGGRY